MASKAEGSQTCTTGTPGTLHALLDTPDKGTYLLVLDVSNLAGLEVLNALISNKVLAADSYLVDERQTFVVADGPIVRMGPVEAPYGAKFEIQMENGSNRVIKYRIEDTTPDGVIHCQAITGTLTTTVITTSLTGLTANALKGKRFCVLGATAGDPGKGSGVIDSNTTGGQITLRSDTPLTGTPANLDHCLVVG